MKKNPIAFILLYPFSLLYSGLISLRNIFYESGLLKSTSFSIPVINVGNLTVGGTGKTPHIEYLIRLLAPYIDVGTLSRGYKRKSKGFRLVDYRDNAATAGDEPMQFKTKFPFIPVAVSESRNIGIPMLLKKYPRLQTVLLDDAFQHRSVVPGLNILLTAYGNLFVDDFLLPAGRLREPKKSYDRADIIVVSKCPSELTEQEQKKIKERITPYPHQSLYFSKYAYHSPYYIFDKSIKLPLRPENRIVLISAIAKVDYLVEDHHYFSDIELDQIKKIYENNNQENSLFLTTEKDAMRLALHRDFLIQNKIPLFVLPVEVEFLNQQGSEFDENIKDFLSNFKV